jgi:hypothetical protein
MWRDERADPPALECQDGKTQLGYRLRYIKDLHAMLKGNGDWVPLGAADEQQPSAGARRAGAPTLGTTGCGRNRW